MPSIGGVNINWDETKPAGTDSVAIGDDQIRSDKTALRTALAAEHVFSASGGANTGAHVLGSARPFYDVQSNASSTGSDGRLFHASDTSRFFGVGSGGTSYIGGPTGLSAGSYPGTVPQRAIWVEEWGIGQTKSGTTTIGIPNSGYSGAAYIQLTTLNNSPKQEMCWVTGVLAASFVVRSSGTDNAGTSSTTFFWRSVGTRTL